MSLEGRSIRNSVDKIKEKTEKDLSDGRPTYSDTDSYEMLFDDEQKPKTQEEKLAFLQSIGVSSLFTGQSIGKATINTPTVEKKEAEAEIDFDFQKFLAIGKKAQDVAKEIKDSGRDL